MSTYSSDEELGPPRILAGRGTPVDFIDVASSLTEGDVRLCLGEADFYMGPVAAELLAAALTRQAARVRQARSTGR